MQTDKMRRKAVQEAYKSRLPEVGILGLVFKDEEKVFLLASLDLKADENSILFKLQSGTQPNKKLVKLYAAQKERVEVQIIERLAYELFDRDDLTRLLKARLHHHLANIEGSELVWKFF